MPETRPDGTRGRSLLAQLPPLLAVILALLLWPIVRPSFWFLFYPAVFFSSWIGGLRAAIAASALSTAAALWFFAEPEHTFAKEPGPYLAAIVFFATGVVFGLFHDRLRKANQRTARALAASQRANEALKRAVNERRVFAALIENSSDFIGIADPAGKPIYVNPGGRRMVGMSPDHRVEETSIPEYYPAEQRAFAADVIVKAMVEKGQWQGETFFRNWQTGAAVPVSDTHFIIREPDTGAVLGMGTITRDISEIQRARDDAERARRELQQAKDAITALVEQAPDGIFVADLSGRYTEVNGAGCRMLGYTREEILAKAIVDLIPPGEAGRLERQKQRLLAGGSDVSEWALRRKDGTYLPVEVSAAILPDGRWQGFVRDVTDRKLHEEELRQAHDRYELALRGADLAAWDWNVETGEVVFNARWAEMRGFRPDEVAGNVDSWISGIHPDDLPRVQRLVDDYFHERVAEYAIEHRVRTKSGQWIWILDRGRIFARDERGRPTRMAGTELDITARKRAEEERRIAEAKASGIVAVSSDAMISIDEQQRIVLFNEGAEKIFGYSKAEAMGAPLEMLIPQRFREVHRRHVERFASADAAARPMGERGRAIYGLRKSGQEFPADAAISRLRIEGTTILTVALRDVTERRRIEQEQALLAEMGTVLASTLELGPTLTSIGRLVARDLADACVVYLVEEERVTHRREVVMRDPAHDWIREALARRPADRSRAPEIWAELEANRSVLIARVSPELREAWARDDDDRRALRALAPQSLIVTPLYAHGRLVGALSLLSCDPTRPYEPVDVRFAEQIAQRAAFAIDNAKLYDDARRAVQSRDDVLGVVAHDLRNPLGTILMQARRFQPGAVDLERKMLKAANSIVRSAQRMDRLIQDLLDVMHLEQHGLTVEKNRIETLQVVQDSVAAQETLATAASLELGLDAADALPDVWADRDRLLQIFENLIGNALKFTEPGGTVRVGAAARAGEVLFWVRDTGIGISAEDAPHVFDRFWQARKSGRRGAGLGLPIVKGLVEAHGGRIWLESALGRGTTFFFTIPTAPPAMVGAAEPAPHGW